MPEMLFQETRPRIPIEDQIACVRRELAQRRRVYPRLIKNESMTKDEAEKELHRMEAVLNTLIWLQENKSIIQQIKRGKLKDEHTG